MSTKAPYHEEKNSLDLKELNRKSIRGGTVTFAAQGIHVGIHLLSTTILARLLSPDDYGIIAMVLAITTFAGLFRDLGLSVAAIQKQNLTHEQHSNLFWLNIATGALLTIIVASLSPLIAWFYKKPELILLTLVLSSTFLIASIGTQHNALMQKQLQFGRRALSQIIGSFTTLISSVVIALLGYGFWALAWGTVLGTLTTTISLFLLSHFRPKLWTHNTEIRSLIQFGVNVTAFDFVNYFSRNLDKILIGRFIGASALGIYSRAYDLLMLPINLLRGPIVVVVFPALSRLNHDPIAWKELYLQSVRLLAYLSMPLSSLLFLTAQPVIILFLGQKWIDIVPIFRILALVAFLQPSVSLLGTVLLSQGRSKTFFLQGTAVSIIVSLGFIIGVHWGEEGAAWSYVITSYLVLLPCLKNTYYKTPVKIKDFFQTIAFPALSSLSIAGLLHIISSSIEIKNEIYFLIFMSISFFIGIILFMLIFPTERKWLMNIRKLF